MANIRGNSEKWQTLFSWAPKSLQMMTAAMKLKQACSLEEKLWQYIKKQRHHFANKSPYRQSYGFCRSHVLMWELDHKESWVPKNWCFQIVVLEKTLKCLLDCKEIKPINPKGNQPWIFIGRTDAEAEAPILWLSDAKSWLTGKDWFWERLKARREGGGREWDSWMASLTHWTLVWANSGI